MTQIALPYNWSPRPYQQRTWDWLSRGGRRAVLNFHRRAGKDELCLMHTACAAFERKANYWHCLPQYGQARKAMWDGVNPHSGRRRIDEAFPAEIRARTLEQEMKIIFQNGSTWQLVGSDNPDSLVGSPPLGIVFSEYALSNPSAWAYLRPIFLENGGWAIFNSTPRGKNHFKAMCELAKKDPAVWFYEQITAKDSGIFTDEALATELHEFQEEHGVEYGKSIWMQEYFCSFDSAILGSIWGDCIARAESEGRIGAVAFDRDFPVSTAWDLGRTDDTVIWFYQMVAGEIRLIDYHASNGKDIGWYAQLLRDKAKERGFVYATHWLPHDARPRTLAGGGKSILQQFIAEKIGRFVILPRLDRQEGIQAARATFPKCWFDLERCEDGIEALRYYHREWDDEKKIFTTEPEHDWSSHPADAFRYLSLSWKNPKSTEPSQPFIERMKRGSVTNQTFGDLKRKHFNRMREQRAETIH